MRISSRSDTDLPASRGLSKNNLTGTIRPMWQLPAVEEMYIGFNMLSGTVSTAVDQLTKLRNL